MVGVVARNAAAPIEAKVEDDRVAVACKRRVHSIASKFTLTFRGSWRRGNRPCKVGAASAMTPCHLPIMTLRKYLLWLMLFVGAASTQAMSIVPMPVEVTAEPGHCVISVGSAIKVSSAGLVPVAMQFVEDANEQCGAPVFCRELAKAGESSALVLELLATPEALLGDEGYRLDVTAQGIRIRANTANGAYYGTRSLLQLLADAGGQYGSRDIGCVAILDYPRLKWRGALLDGSRHFFDLAFMRKHLDRLAAYKFNTFHWHLTDNQGWRVEIKSLPELTKIGAWRAEGVAAKQRPAPGSGLPQTYGGFYTQEELRELVRFAALRGITILPEIDTPGHSNALTATYPELTCSGSPASEMCVGNEKVYEVLEKVIAELAPIFPGKYFHIGGDEVNPAKWKTCPKCQALMQRERMTDLNQLEPYFIRRMEKILAKHGKTLVGWQEIFHQDATAFAPGTVAIAWDNSDKPGQTHKGERYRAMLAEAVRAKHQIVVTPDWPCYLSKWQGDASLEPRGWKNPAGRPLRLTDVYGFEPVPAGVPAELVLGAQLCLWTEWTAETGHVEYMMWPRGLALAEAFWSSREKQSWPDFVKRLPARLEDFERTGTRYAISAYMPAAELIETTEGRRVKLDPEIPGAEIRYSFTGYIPDRTAPLYTKPLAIPDGATEIRVATYRDGKRLGELMKLTITELEDRVNFWKPTTK